MRRPPRGSSACRAGARPVGGRFARAGRAGVDRAVVVRRSRGGSAGQCDAAELAGLLDGRAGSTGSRVHAADVAASNATVAMIAKLIPRCTSQLCRYARGAVDGQRRVVVFGVIGWRHVAASWQGGLLRASMSVDGRHRPDERD